jgi:hypothetical protein
VSSEPENSGGRDDEVEVVDGVPVPVAVPPEPSRTPEVLRTVQVPAVQAAALAATSFVAGAATVAMMAHRRSRAARRRRRKKGPIGEIVGSNSFLVDVHLIRRD